MTLIDLERIVGVHIEGASDSRAQMKKIAKLLGLDEAATEEQILEALKGRLDISAIAKALDLADDASEEEILDAIKASKEAAEEGETSLEDRAKAEGKVVLDKETLDTLRADSKAGKKAAEELHQSKFDRAYEEALKDPKGARVDAKDETRERWQKIYDADADACLEALEALPHLVNGQPAGSGGGVTGGEVPDNVDEDRFELNERVEKRMAADDCSYEEALRKVRAEGDED